MTEYHTHSPSSNPTSARLCIRNPWCVVSPTEGDLTLGPCRLCLRLCLLSMMFGGVDQPRLKCLLTRWQQQLPKIDSFPTVRRCCYQWVPLTVPTPGWCHSFAFAKITCRHNTPGEHSSSKLQEHRNLPICTCRNPASVRCSVALGMLSCTPPPHLAHFVCARTAAPPPEVGFSEHLLTGECLVPPANGGGGIYPKNLCLCTWHFMEVFAMHMSQGHESEA